MNNDIIGGGAVTVATFSMSNLLLFNDDVMTHVSIAGAVLSFLGTLSLLSENHFKDELGNDLDIMIVVLRLIKSVIFGALGILIWFFFLKSFGSDMIVEYLDVENVNIKIIDTVWLLLSGLLSWYSVPILNKIFRNFKSRGG